MQRRPLLWLVISLLSLAGAIYFWQLGDKWQAERRAAHLPPAAMQGTNSAAALPIQSAPKSPLQFPSKSPTQNLAQKVSAATAKNHFPYRLSNTSKSLSQLLGNDKAILLANALIDTANPAKPAIPDRLRAPANSGSYIVQASGPMDDRFRAILAEANATVVSYIPNNAYLVRVSDSGAQALSGNPFTQSVLPYEPYYKLDSSLLTMAMEQTPLPPNTGLNVTTFPDARDVTLKALQGMGADVVGVDNSPFGPVFQIHPTPNMLTDVASLPGVQLVSAAHPRVSANDMTRATLGVSTDSVTNANYLGLTGSNVLVNINDSGVDTNHPDLSGRITGDTTNSLVDPIGHGTHVAGTILGSGAESATVTNAQGSVTNANFRGMAPNAKAYAIAIFSTPNTNSLQAAEIDGVLSQQATELISTLGLISDSYLQTQAALTNAFISNNSWNYANFPAYDIAAASYDAAVRDALPGVPGPQPILYVFSAGDSGFGNEDGTGGFADSIMSPATAKNVITVGAIEQLRNITNFYVVTNYMTNGILVSTNMTTNFPFASSSDSSDQVASFSSRGNVGIGTEGMFGRFKPDLVAPGTFVISDRSTDWDTNSYYNPTNFSHLYNYTTDINSLTQFPFIVWGGDVVSLVINVVTNGASVNPFPPMLIYASVNSPPALTTNYLVGTNQISVPSQLPLNAGDVVYFGVQAGGTNQQPVNFDVEITEVTTNDNSGYFGALTNLNSGVGPFYRYESGTSMSAAGVSGMLACMQEFFQGRLQLTNSPALMKALLINGARSVSQQYDFNVANTVTSQGWGLPNLPDTIPAALANLNVQSGMPANAPNLPLLFFDQSPTNALATGQSKTRLLALTPDGGSVPLRVTLVWTDPPGNPAAGVKLVNNLVLIVTNIDTGDVFYGNDIPSGDVFNEAWDTNGPPNIDLVNNVQNVYLVPPLSTNYSVTVMAQRVNVNAVTANTNNVVQDYALVISSGDAGDVPNPFASLTENNLLISTNLPVLTTITNAMPLFNQRVGANPQAAPTTNGIASQWNFYVYTNTVAITNAAFTGVVIGTSSSVELAMPQMGAFDEINETDINGTRWTGGTNIISSLNNVQFTGADIDLYVSTNSSLTNLNPAVIATAQTSTMQGGNELVVYTNSTGGQVYYIGIKSEDQQGAQFTILGAAFDPLASPTDTNGNVPLMVLTPLPVPIPGGFPASPGMAQIFAFTTSQAAVRKVVVTNTVTCQNFGDYIGTLTGPANHLAVLNNHTFFTNVNDATEMFIYDDSGEGSIPGARATDNPGTLRNFVGDKAGSGLWTFTMVNDSSQFDTGVLTNVFSITIYPQPPTNTFFQEFINSGGWFYDYVDVPPNATNLSISVGVPAGPSVPLGLYVRRGAFPTTSNYDQFLPLPQDQTNTLSITAFDSPPLNPGRYFYGIFNPNLIGETVYILVNVGISVPTTSQTWLLSTNTPMFLPDDAVTNSSLFVGVNEAVAEAQVGVRIAHPRESDLVLTLISPQGTRVLLAENRGGEDTNGYGGGVNITNVFPQSSTGSSLPQTNNLIINTNANGGLSSGTLIIDYNMFTIPDDMRVYYDNVLIFDSGLVSFTGTYTVNYGPGAATNILVVMNAPGTNPNSSTNNNGDQWTYTVTAIQQHMAYAIFTDDTNEALVPIKFAVPPFGTNISGYGTLFSDFETTEPGNYFAPAVVDGWSVLSNEVTVLTAPPSANSGTNFLALRNGSLSQTLVTTPGTTYALQFAEERAVPLDPVHWWPGNSNTMDIMGIDPQDGAWLPLGSDTYDVGEVNQAFSFDTNGSNYVKVVANPSLDIGAANGFTVDCWISPANVKAAHPLLEWNDGSGLSPGLAMWISANGAGTLSANLVDNSRGRTNYLVSSASGLIKAFAFQHVALTYSRTNNGLAKLYYNGAVVATTNLGTNITIQTSSAFDLYFGVHITSPTNPAPRFVGLMDEIGLYNQALTDAQIQDIYAAGSLGRCGTLNPPSVCPTPMANVSIGGVPVTTIMCGPTATNWTTEPLSFTASTSGTLLEIDSTNNPSGVLLDSFTLTGPGQNNFYFPEEPLAKLIGENALGNWQLEVMDNRAGATNPPPQLLSWELNFTFVTPTPTAAPLVHGVTVTNFVAPNSIVYFAVAVPVWAGYATNILFNVTNGPLNLLFNQNYLPGTNASDYSLTNGVLTSSTNTLDTITSTPPLVPGQTYYLGVQNPGTNTASFSIQVDFNIITLTNGIPFTNTAPVSTVQYYQYFVSTNNAVATAFEILNPNGNVILVAREGAPLPDLAPGDYNYISANPGSNNQAIVVLTNSTPVALAPGQWYLGVFNNDTNTVNYRIRALESDATNYPNIIWLTNGVPFTTNAAPGVALTNFYGFAISNSPSAALFEIYSNSGNVDLTLQYQYTNLTFTNLPYSPPFFDGSFNPGTMPEQIVIRTNVLGTNINGAWFLGVPNDDPTNVTYTIYAEVSTNGILAPPQPPTISITPAPPGSTNGLTLTWPTITGETYWIQDSTNLVTWTTIATNNAPGTTGIFVTPPPVPGIPFVFFRILQVPTP